MRGNTQKACLSLAESSLGHDSILPKKIHLSDGTVKIGRGSSTVPVDIILAIKSQGKEIISRCHAQIIGDNGIYEIHDNRSINGVFVNHVRIEKAILQEGDHVQFGGVAKVPVGKSVKVSAEHATYIFSYLPPTTEPTSSMSSTSHLPLPLNSSTAPHHSKERRELSEKNQQLQEEIDSLKQQLDISKKSSQSIGINTSPLPRIPERVPESTPLRHKSASCSIDFSALEDLLKCSLCQMILLDAVVCRCSHGFCRACLETYYRKPRVISSPLFSSIYSLCPICVGEASSDSKRKLKISSKDQPFNRQYCRSANLDSVVYLLQQTRSSEEMELFTQREKEHHQILRSYGIDPLASPLEEQQCQEEGPENLGEALGTSLATKKVVKKIICDYCGEEGHGAKECPHDDQNDRRKRSRYGQFHQENDQQESDSYGSESG